MSEHLTPDEMDGHLYEVRAARWCVLAALVVFWFAAVCGLLWVAKASLSALAVPGQIGTQGAGLAATAGAIPDIGASALGPLAQATGTGNGVTAPR